jgi:hypothetical protein
LVFAFSSILAPSINAGTFLDDFNDGKADGWVVFEGKWEVVNGEYRAPVEVNKVPYPLTFALDGKEYGEFTIEAKIRNDKFHSTMNQAHAGFAFGMDSKGTGYVLYFRFHKGITCAGGAVVIRRIIENLRGGCDPNADVAEGCDVFNAMDIGNWHTLKAEVSAKNGTIKAWVDGKASIDIKLSDKKLKMDTGKVGLWTADLGAASFDDVSITGPDIPASDVQPASKLSATWGSIKAQ